MLRAAWWSIASGTLLACGLAGGAESLGAESAALLEPDAQRGRDAGPAPESASYDSDGDGTDDPPFPRAPESASYDSNGDGTDDMPFPRAPESDAYDSDGDGTDDPPFPLASGDPYDSDGDGTPD
jgi:hypothetical protein